MWWPLLLGQRRQKEVGGAQIETDPTCLDAIPPENEFAGVEADSSQQCAIAGISGGQSAVVHGPPGTGKSQTITNLIATLAASGKKVLFVAENRDGMAAFEQSRSREGGHPSMSGCRSPIRQVAPPTSAISSARSRHLAPDPHLEDRPALGAKRRWPSRRAASESGGIGFLAAGVDGGDHMRGREVGVELRMYSRIQ